MPGDSAFELLNVPLRCSAWPSYAVQHETVTVGWCCRHCAAANFSPASMFFCSRPRIFSSPSCS